MNDDMISRQAAIDEIDEWIKAFLENGHKESAADARLIKDGIIQLPSAQPEQKIGYWIPIHPLQNDDEGAYLCSNCKTGDWDIKPTDKFCKFCGTKMQGVKKNNV